MFEMLRKILLVSLVGLFCCYQTVSSEVKVHVKSQSEFDALPNSIETLLKKIPQNGKETVTVYFSGGTYRSNQNLSFVNFNRPNVSIHFTANPGEKVHFVGGGNEYVPAEKISETTAHYFVPLKGSYCRGEVYVDQNHNLVPISDSGDLLPQKISRAASRREKISQVATGKYSVDYARFKLPAELSFIKNKGAAYFKNKLICFKLWFSQGYGTIAKTDNEYIYFYHATSGMFDLLEANPGWDAFKGFPLFYITNVTDHNNTPQAGKVLITNGGIYIPKGITKLYECKRQLMIGSWDSYFKELKFTNLYFSGAASFDYETYYKEEQVKNLLLTYDGISNYRSAFMSFNNTDNVVFQNCEFSNLGSVFAVSVTIDEKTYIGSGGVTFEDNKAYNLGGQVIQSFVRNTKIKRNQIHNTGLFSSGRPDPILVISDGYEVANNTIYDFTGNGITIGYNVCSPLMIQYPINGVVRENELYLTPDYLNHLERYTLEDAHAIYFVNHQTNSICEGNIIHDFEGYKFVDGTGRCNNKAIAIDCQGYNVTVKKNLVYNMADHAFVVEYQNTHHANSTTNIQLENNVFFVSYRIKGNPSFPTSSGVSNNYMAEDSKGKHYNLLKGLPKIKTNIRVGSEITDLNAEVKNGKCYITKDISSLDLSAFVKSRLVYPLASPVIVQNPIDKKLIPGNQLTLFVTATGENLSYQWKKGGVNIGGNSATYSKNGVTAADAGSYTCTVSNTSGSVTSNPAVVTVSQTFTMTLSANPSYGGMVSGGGSFASGTILNLVATPNPGYDFVNWTNANGGIVYAATATTSFLLNANYSLIATFQPTAIAVTSVEVSQPSAAMQVGGELQLTATAKPSNATDKALTWSSDNPTVATVDANGFVKALKEGTANITATAKSGSSVSCIITVSKNTAIPVIDLKGKYVANGQKVKIKVIGEGSGKFTKIYVNEQLTTELQLNTGIYVVIATNDNGTLRIETVVNVLGQGQ